MVSRVNWHQCLEASECRDDDQLDGRGCAVLQHCANSAAQGVLQGCVSAPAASVACWAVCNHFADSSHEVSVLPADPVAVAGSVLRITCRYGCKSQHRHMQGAAGPTCLQACIRACKELKQTMHLNKTQQQPLLLPYPPELLLLHSEAASTCSATHPLDSA